MLRELEPLATTPGAYVFAAVFGLLWGSFANVCIYRWPAGLSVVAPGSRCSSCGTPIKWYDNLPLLSWVLLRGKCRACKAAFSGRYLMVEALTGLLFVLAWWFTVTIGAYLEPFDTRLIRFAIYAAFCFVLVVVTFIDLDHKLILDKLTLPAIPLFYGLSFLLPDHRWYDGLAGAGVGYLLPWAIGEIYWLVTAREGLGLGDAKLLAVVGALLGMRGVVATLFGGALIGAVFGVFGLVRGGKGSRGGAIAAVVAVASVVAAAWGALTDHVVVGAIGSAGALAALVVSRRLEVPATEEASATTEAAEVDDPPLPAKERLARGMALVSGAFVLGGTTFALLEQTWMAAGAGLVGVGLLLLAKRMIPVVEAPTPEPPPSAADETENLMRMELPFGPFLALAAVIYLFAEPWIRVNFHLPGG